MRLSYVPTPKSLGDKIITDLERFTAYIKFQKEDGCRMGLLFGFFDKIDDAIINFFYDAKKQVDFLIVAVVCDQLAQEMRVTLHRNEDSRLFSAANIQWPNFIVLIRNFEKAVKVISPNVVFLRKDSCSFTQIEAELKKIRQAYQNAFDLEISPNRERKIISERICDEEKRKKLIIG